MGNYPAALEKLSPLVQQKSNDLSLHKLLARIHLRQGDRSAALVHYRRALELAPGDAKLRASVEKLEATSGGQP